MEKKEVKWSRLFALGLGGILGLSHIGMIGTLMNRESKLPSINVPVGPYTAYEAEVGKEGYRIKYRANDPLVMRVERDSNTKGGFLGLGNNKVKTIEQYTMDGSVHTRPNSSSTTIADGKSEAVSKQSEEQKTQEDSWVPVLVLVLLLVLPIFPLLVGCWLGDYVLR